MFRMIRDIAHNKDVSISCVIRTVIDFLGAKKIQEIISASK